MGVGDARMFTAYLAVVVAAGHGLHITDNLQTGGVAINDKGRVAGLENLSLRIGAGDDNGKAGASGQL
jgi:hypothetical protein